MISEANGLTKKRTVSIVLEFIILVSLLFIIVVSPLLKGLYFASELYFIETVTFFTYILFWINKIIKKEKRLSANYIDIAVISLVIAYGISFIFSINHRTALEELTKYFMYFALFNMISYFAINKRYRSLLMRVTVTTGIFLCVLAFDGVSGSYISRFFNEIFNITRIPLRFYGLVEWNRLQSTFQYSNAFAGFLTGLFYLALGLCVTSKKQIEKITYSAICYLFMCTLIYTYSRAAYVTFVLAAIFMLVIIPKGNKLKSALYLIVPIVANLIMGLKISSIIQNGQADALKLLVFLILGATLNTILFICIDKIKNILKKISRKVYFVCVGIAAVILVGGVLLASSYWGPIVIDRTGDASDSNVTYTKSVSLEDGKKYKLVIKDEINNAGKPNAYTLSVISKNQNDILSGKSGTQIGYYQGTATEDNLKGEVYFTVPENSEIIQINISSFYAGTTAKIKELTVADAWTGSTIKKIPLNYNLISNKLQERITNFKGSKDLLQRMTYYKDGLEMYKDYWILGAGGGAWGLLYGMYQNYYYVSSQIHNYLLQVGVESGILGVGAIIFLIGSLFYLYRKFIKSSRRKIDDVLPGFLLTGIIGMLMHAMTDFDFSLPAVYMLLWMMAAILSSFCKASASKINDKEDGKISVTEKLRIIRFHPVIGLCISILIFIMPATFAVGAAATTLADKYADTDSKKSQKILEIGKSIDFTNSMLKYYYVKEYVKNHQTEENTVSEETLNKIKMQISEIEKAEKSNPDILPIISSLNFIANDFEKAKDFSELAVNKRPFFASVWQTKISMYYQIMLHMLRNGDSDQAIEYAQAIMNHKNAAQFINKNSIIPVLFNKNTIEMMEVAKFIDDNKYLDIDVNPEKIIFYNFAEIDEDNDTWPDEWTVEGGADIRLLYNYNMMLVRSHLTKSEAYNIRSRELSLEPNKTYVVEVLPYDKNGDSINYTITGLTNGVLNYSQGVYYGEFNTPSDFKSSNNSLTLNLQGDWDLRRVSIVEK